jgi:hypothetical protein
MTVNLRGRLLETLPVLAISLGCEKLILGKAPCINGLRYVVGGKSRTLPDGL